MSEQDGDTNMRHRRSDDAMGNPIRVTREIPLWGILTVIGALGAQGVSAYYGQARLVENVAGLTTEVRALATEVNSLTRTQTGFQFQLEDMRRRLEALEALNPPVLLNRSKAP